MRMRDTVTGNLGRMKKTGRYAHAHDGRSHAERREDQSQADAFAPVTSAILTIQWASSASLHRPGLAAERGGGCGGAQGGWRGG